MIDYRDFLKLFKPAVWLYATITFLPSIILLTTVMNALDNQSTLAFGSAIIYGFILTGVMVVFGITYLFARKAIFKNIVYACFFGILLLIALPVVLSPLFKS